MKKFKRETGVAVSFPQANIDTDAILPAQWMRSTSTDLGDGLFGRRRYDADGKEVPGFILNRMPYRHAKILVGGPNFGCGSSRESAVWALQSFGIRSVIASSFGDIFFENSFKNGLLPVLLPQEEVSELLSYLSTTNDPSLTIDLENCTVETPQGRTISFAISGARRTALLEGLDEIGQTLRHENEIAAFETRDRAMRPWIHRRASGLIEKARG